MTLIERLEISSGADRELDCRISAATGGVVAEGLPDADYASLGEEYEFRDHQDCLQTSDLATDMGVPRYTASLDAAITLAKDFGGQITFFKDGTAKVFLWQPYPVAVECKAATPALALCIAALRARGIQ